MSTEGTRATDMPAVFERLAEAMRSGAPEPAEVEVRFRDGELRLYLIFNDRVGLDAWAELVDVPRHWPDVAGRDGSLIVNVTGRFVGTRANLTANLAGGAG